MSSQPPPGMEGRGTDTVQLSNLQGRVFLHFEAAVEWVSLDCETAAALSEAMARAAYAARFGDTPTTQKQSQITERIRVKLVKRVEIMLNSFSTDSPVPAHKVQATQIVDTCLNEMA